MVTNNMEEMKRVTAPLIPFWESVQAIHVAAGRQTVTDADVLAGLFQTNDSLLVRLLNEGGVETHTARVEIEAAVSSEGAAVPAGAVGIGISAQRVIDAMLAEWRARGGVQRQEHVLLGLLSGGGARVQMVLTRLGIDRERVLRQLQQ